MKILLLIVILMLIIYDSYSLNIKLLRKPMISLSITISSLSLLLLLPSNTLAISVKIDKDLSATQLVQQGMKEFKLGDLVKSVEYFDEARLKKPELDNYLWQRGLSLYYMNEYDSCADQFRKDVVVNKDDTEEAVWNVACQTQKNYENGKGDKSLELARKTMLPVGNDRRSVMNIVYAVFKGTLPEEKLIEAQGNKDDLSINFFYSKLYQSLLKDIKQEKAEGLVLMKEAIDSKYAQDSNDYMVTLAKNAINFREMEMEQ